MIDIDEKTQKKLDRLLKLENNALDLKAFVESEIVQTFLTGLEADAVGRAINLPLDEDDKRRAAACQAQTVRSLRLYMANLVKYGERAGERRADALRQGDQA